METIIANLAGTTRRETLNGRAHIVASATLVVPGVLNGSQGPLYYPPDELAKSVDSWNGMPIVVYHPVENGTPVSARSPEVLNKSGVGVVLRARHQDKLTAEAWFDIERLREVDARVLNALEQGQAVELSTGLFTANEPSQGEFNGKAYIGIARNHRPDHLAVLPDQVGACSIDDGCGVLVNAENGGITERTMDALAGVLEVMGYTLGLNGGGKDKMSKRDVRRENRRRLTKKSTNTTDKSGDDDMKMNDQQRKSAVDSLIANCKCPFGETDRETLNAFADPALTAMVEKYKVEPPATNAEPAPLPEIEVEGKTYTYNAEAKKYEPKPEPKPEPTANTSKPKSEEEWLAEAPEAVRTAVLNAKRLAAEEKAGLINKLISNMADGPAKDSAKKVYESMTAEQLRPLAAAIPAPANNSNRPLYVGANPPEPTFNATSAEYDADDYYDMPTINWKEQAAAPKS